MHSHSVIHCTVYMQKICEDLLEFSVTYSPANSSSRWRQDVCWLATVCHCLFCLYSIFVCYITHSVCSPLVYDRMMLLNIRSAVTGCLFSDPRDDWHLHSHFVPVALRKMCYLPGCLCMWRKRRSKRGKRAGVLVRSKRIGKFPVIGPVSLMAEAVIVNLRCSYIVPVFPSSVLMPQSSRMVYVKRQSADRGVNHRIFAIYVPVGRYHSMIPLCDLLMPLPLQ